MAGKEVFSNSGDNLIINSESKNLIARVKGEIEIFLKKTNCQSSEMLNYIKNNNTCVYYSSFAVKILPLIKEEPGFITELKGS